MSCEFCVKRDKPVPLAYLGPEFGCLFIEGRSIVLEVRSESVFRSNKKRQVFPARFCPICGDKLDGGES